MNDAKLILLRLRWKMTFWLEGVDEVDDNRIISMEIISVMSRCPWPNDTYHFPVTEHYQNYWHQVQPYQHSNTKGYTIEVRSNWEHFYRVEVRINLTLSRALEA